VQQSNDLEASKDCWERAATGHLAQKSPWHAAKSMEKAGEAARDMRQWADTRSCFQSSAELYLEEGRPGSAAEAVVKGAKALEEPDPAAATELYLQAIGWLEDSEKDVTAGETFRMAIAHLVRSQRWAEAASVSLRYASSCDRAGARHSLCKAYLGAVVIWLFAADASQAWLTYQDALAVSEFSSSDEAFAAEALFEAYKSADAEAVAAAVKSHSAFSHLDNCNARLARRLPQGDVVAMATALGGSGAGGGGEPAEEDLT